MACEPRLFPQCHPTDFPGYHPDPLDCARQIRNCYTATFGPIQISAAGRTAAVSVRAATVAEAIQKVRTGPTAFLELWQRALAEQPKHFGFLGFGVGASTLGILRTVFSAVPQIVGSLVNPAIGLAGALAQQTAYQVQRSQQAMALDLGALIGGIGGAVANIGGFTNNPFLQATGQIAGAFGAATARPTMVSAPSYGPVYSPQNLPVVSQPRPILVSSGGGMVPTTKNMMTSLALEGGQRLLGALGLSYASVGEFYSKTKRAISAMASLARRTPVGSLIEVLVGLGLTADMAAHLLAWYQTKGRKYRRMNVANPKALRRSLRRIRGFDRLSSRVYARLHLGRPGRRTRRGPCRVCKTNPCVC